MSSTLQDMGVGPSLFGSSEWECICESLGLTGRQSEILEWVLQDLTEDDMAEELGLSRYTVHAHIQRMYAKLGVGSRVQLVLAVVAAYMSLASRTQCISVPSRCPLHKHSPA